MVGPEKVDCFFARHSRFPCSFNWSICPMKSCQQDAIYDDEWRSKYHRNPKSILHKKKSSSIPMWRQRCRLMIIRVAKVSYWYYLNCSHGVVATFLRVLPSYHTYGDNSECFRKRLFSQNLTCATDNYCSECVTPENFSCNKSDEYRLITKKNNRDFFANIHYYYERARCPTGAHELSRGVSLVTLEVTWPNPYRRDGATLTARRFAIN